MDTSTPTATHGMSINVYGRGDATLGDGPSHMGIAVYEFGSPTCKMHHIRNPNDTDFIYDPRTQPLEDPVLRGRCEIATFSNDSKERVIRLLTDFGNDESNIPEFGIGNCQDWVAAAALMLEQAGLLKQGEGAFWRGMVNSSADEMRDSCLRTGRTWVAGPESTFEGEPDARFNDKTTVQVGKLAQNPMFQARMQSLLGNRQGQQSSSQETSERPFYISSPFFSRANVDG
ncbi:hypothetical protein P170DRAFT_441116 [Aspergillus steynii IBT 23096]|uniref:Uncharacterized protein n=1 Tax=Aspergillus steynii IBT 23096 TaxID=1392250 RepID=A0A2I2FSQ8_9EURO|nr:uncharacterized protein P170DRAFT_441116 [Aspergillus steynii IBT 23096]PLB43657.1 hypothetical protein P170DRAFT_441116 [Aspergillus steynii IBT 23096]